VKVILFVVAILAMLFVAGCGLLGSSERVNEQPHKTVFRSANESDIDNPDATPIPSKVPGEETRVRR
jgi:hypothetical protein